MRCRSGAGHRTGRAALVAAAAASLVVALAPSAYAGPTPTSAPAPGLVPGAVPASAGVVAAALATGGSADAWLAEVNKYRTAAGLRPVVENRAWVVGLQHHFTYLEKTDRSLRTGAYASAHTENPKSPWFTVDGEQAGRSSDLFGGSIGPRADIDVWLSAPYHAIGMLRPSLGHVAYASDGIWSGLDVIRGLGEQKDDAEHPILLPAAGMTTNLSRFPGESPDPVESCRTGHYAHQGLPLIAMLASAPTTDLSATLTGPEGTQTSATGQLCVVDEHAYYSSDPVYGAEGREILQYDHAVLLIPEKALSAGTYTATIRQGGRSDVRWSFTSTPGARDPGAPTSVTAVSGHGSLVVGWQAPAADGGSPVTSYTATTQPGGATCTTAATARACTVWGLAEGTAYTATVVATNAVGSSPPSASSANAVPGRPDTVAPRPTTGTLPAVTTESHLHLDLAATDDDSGVAALQVRVRSATWRTGPGAWTVPAAWRSLAAGPLAVALAPGQTRCVSARARDRAGNWSAWSTSRCAGRAVDDRVLHRSAGWTRRADGSAYAGGVTATRRAHAVLTLPGARGRRIGVIATTGPGAGRIAVYLGRHLLGRLSLAAATTTSSRLLLLPASGHRAGTLRIVTLSRHRPVRIDGVVVSAA
jgi:hypothetical protein